eukprot:scaffold6711_cov118-Isochrysis_galbana.AAC.4
MTCAPLYAMCAMRAAQQQCAGLKAFAQPCFPALALAALRHSDEQLHLTLQERGVRKSHQPQAQPRQPIGDFGRAHGRPRHPPRTARRARPTTRGRRPRALSSPQPCRRGHPPPSGQPSWATHRRLPACGRAAPGSAPARAAPLPTAPNASPPHLMRAPAAAVAKEQPWQSARWRSQRASSSRASPTRRPSARGAPVRCRDHALRPPRPRSEEAQGRPYTELGGAYAAPARRALMRALTGRTRPASPPLRLQTAGRARSISTRGPRFPAATCAPPRAPVAPLLTQRCRALSPCDVHPQRSNPQSGSRVAQGCAPPHPPRSRRMPCDSPRCAPHSSCLPLLPASPGHRADEAPRSYPSAVRGGPRQKRAAAAPGASASASMHASAPPGASRSVGGERSGAPTAGPERSSANATASSLHAARSSTAGFRAHSSQASACRDWETQPTGHTAPPSCAPTPSSSPRANLGASARAPPPAAPKKAADASDAAVAVVAAVTRSRCSRRESTSRRKSACSAASFAAPPTAAKNPPIARPMPPSARAASVAMAEVSIDQKTRQTSFQAVPLLLAGAASHNARSASVALMAEARSCSSAHRAATPSRKGARLPTLVALSGGPRRRHTAHWSSHRQSGPPAVFVRPRAPADKSPLVVAALPPPQTPWRSHDGTPQPPDGCRRWRLGACASEESAGRAAAATAGSRRRSSMRASATSCSTQSADQPSADAVNPARGPRSRRPTKEPCGGSTSRSDEAGDISRAARARMASRRPCGSG